MSHRTEPRFVPLSTYRLQVHGGFPLAAARDVVPYLACLGVSTCYTSPYFAAGPGSTHGYDVADHNEVNAEAGGLPALQDAARRPCQPRPPAHRRLRPQSHGNRRWPQRPVEGRPRERAELACGGLLRHRVGAGKREALHAKLLLPILGDQYGRVLERGELKVGFRDGQLLLTYGDNDLPINPRQSPRVFRVALEPLTAALGADHPALQEFQSIITALQNLPPYTERRPDLMAQRQREKDVARTRLSPARRGDAGGRRTDRGGGRGVQRRAGPAGNASTSCTSCSSRSPIGSSYWRTASHEINYRRFFDINTLAGLRVEDARRLRRDARRCSKRCSATASSTGCASTIPDGLFDPARYFEMLQDARCPRLDIERRLPMAAGRPGALYVVAEKILSGREALPSKWAVHGTTGYNFLNDLNGLFVSAAHARRMRRTYAQADRPRRDVRGCRSTRASG